MESQQIDFMDAKATIDKLLRKSLILGDSAKFVDFFNFIGRFDSYSRYNSLLVYIQNPKVRVFGGVSYWEKRDRTIKKDARPYIILCPKGPIMLVYDIKDTDGEKIPSELMVNTENLYTNKVIGTLNLKTYHKALEEIEKWGIKLSFKQFKFLKHGEITASSNNIEISSKKEESNEKKFVTIIHELAHLFLGHLGDHILSYSNYNKGKNKQLQIKKHSLERFNEELEAEAVSYLICHRLGLQTQSAEYLADYVESEKDLLSFCYEHVIKTVDKIEKLFIKHYQKMEENLYTQLTII